MMVYNSPMMLKKMSKMQLIRKVLRDTTQAQKNQMLKLALGRLSKAGLIKLCMAIGKNKLMKLKTLTTSKGMNRKTSKPKAFKQPKGRKYRVLRKGKKREKLKAGIHFVIVSGKKRKVKVLKNGQWRFMKQ